MSLRPKKGTGRRVAKQREQKLRDKLHWTNIGHYDYENLHERIQAIDGVRDKLTPSQRNRFLQIEDDFHNEQATPAFVRQDLAALEKELKGKTKSKVEQVGPTADYFRCINCGAVVTAGYGDWPTCECREVEGTYSHRLSDDFDSATEEEYDEWLSEQED